MLAYNFNRADKSKFQEKKQTIVLNFREKLLSYRSLLMAYGHLFSQLNETGVLTSRNTFNSESYLENRREIRAIGYYTSNAASVAQIRYLELFGNDSAYEVNSLISTLDLRKLTAEVEGLNEGVILRINANYIIYIAAANEQDINNGNVFLIINQQDIFRMLSKYTPAYVEYRIFDISSRPTPVFTHTMDNRTFFPFTRTRSEVEELITVGSFSWLFRFYFYDSFTEITQFLIVLVTIILGLIISLMLYTFSLRNHRAMRKAHHLESQKDEFVAIASHELKTPLTSIKALNQILAQKMATEGNILFDSFFRKMDSQIIRMENLINDLLDVSRIRSGKLSYTLNYFDLEQVVRNACEEITTIRKTHKIVINGAIKKQVFGDKDRISQVITNILVNSIKYSPQANLIIVGMEETQKEAIISVQDFGIGITRENQKRIFDRFYRVSTDEHMYKGLGIGLFISSEVIAKHKGKIWVKSKKNKGSTFYFSLPFHPTKVK